MESAGLERKIGILGGGQLARMLIEASEGLGLRAVPFVQSSFDSAAQVASDFRVGQLDDPDSLGAFFASVQAVVFENEFVPRWAIEAGLEKTPRGQAPRFLPDFSAIETLQNKLRQKRLLAELGIPCPEFREFTGGEAELAPWLEALRRDWNGEVVLKWAELGYDGKGTCIGMEKAESFARDAVLLGRPLFAERRVRFRRELSIVACFSISGEFAAWPLVQSVQENGICREVMGPATSLGTPAELELQAREAALKIARRLSLFGTFAIELFETEDGRLLVNELAPRVHNTGHWSQDGAFASQFENHWRAVLGLPLGSCAAKEPFFGMFNWLGSGSAQLEPGSVPVVQVDGRFHWYGKNSVKPGRKLGHVNVVARSAEGLKTVLERARRAEAAWRQSLGHPT